MRSVSLLAFVGVLINLAGREVLAVPRNVYVYDTSLPHEITDAVGVESGIVPKIYPTGSITEPMPSRVPKVPAIINTGVGTTTDVVSTTVSIPGAVTPTDAGANSHPTDSTVVPGTPNESPTPHDQEPPSTDSSAIPTEVGTGGVPESAITPQKPVPEITAVPERRRIAKRDDSTIKVPAINQTLTLVPKIYDTTTYEATTTNDQDSAASPTIVIDDVLKNFLPVADLIASLLSPQDGVPEERDNPPAPPMDKRQDDPPFRDPKMDQIYPPAPEAAVSDPPSRDPKMDQIYRPEPTPAVFDAVVNDLIGGDLLDPFGSHVSIIMKREGVDTPAASIAQVVTPTVTNSLPTDVKLKGRARTRTDVLQNLGLAKDLMRTALPTIPEPTAKPKPERRGIAEREDPNIGDIAANVIASNPGLVDEVISLVSNPEIQSFIADYFGGDEEESSSVVVSTSTLSNGTVITSSSVVAVPTLTESTDSSLPSVPTVQLSSSANTRIVTCGMGLFLTAVAMVLLV